MISPSQLFVYGTLRKGFGNHVLMQNCVPVGEGTIKAILYGHGMLPMIGKGDREVRGEVYTVPTLHEWMRLDRLEGHPNWYRREIVDVVLDDGSTTEAWAYFMRPEHLDNYLEGGSHTAAAAIVESGDYAILRSAWS